MIICSLCGSSKLKLLAKLKKNFKIYFCQNCTCALTDPEPSVNYDNHPFSNLAISNTSLWRSYSYRIIKFIEGNFGSNGRLLDVGCSHGLLIQEAGKIGFDAEGLEPSKTSFEYCKLHGLNVLQGYLAEGLYPPNSFDVVVMAHVIEHVSDPLKLLKIAREIIKPGGILCLSQTNFQGTLPKMLNRYWGYWTEDEHYYHFSQTGITLLLQKAGFQTPLINFSSLDYHIDFRVENPRSILKIFSTTFKYLVSKYRIGFPFKGDQMYVLTSPTKQI